MPGRTVQFNVVMCISVSWKISLYDCVSITCTSSLKYSCIVKQTYLFSVCVYFVVVFCCNIFAIIDNTLKTYTMSIEQTSIFFTIIKICCTL